MKLSNDIVITMVDYIDICLVGNVHRTSKNCILLEDDDIIVVLEQFMPDKPNEYNAHTAFNKNQIVCYSVRNQRKCDKHLVMDDEYRIFNKALEEEV